MVAPTQRTGAALLLAASLAMAGCAAGSGLPRAVKIEPGRRTAVRLMQFADGQVFTLQNASSGTAADVYSDPRGDQLTKVVSDEQLQALLDVFAEKGMFAAAQGSVPPDARDALAVQQEERRWTWSRRIAGTAAHELAFHEAKAYFLSLYNHATAYHSSGADNRPDLKAENDRARREAAAAKRKLESIRGRQPQGSRPQGQGQ